MARLELQRVLEQIDLPAWVEADGSRLRGDRELYGPCPRCGGDDRFHLKRHAGQWFWFCRQCHFDVDGRMWHDAGDYARWVRGIGMGELMALAARRPMTSVAFPGPRATALPEQPPCELWQTRGWAFVRWCEANLWSGSVMAQQALDYLRGPKRHLADETIRRFRLGLSPCMWKMDAAGWGIPERGWVVAVPGIVIPHTSGGQLWGITIRRLGRDSRRKYVQVTGSRASLFNADSLPGAETVLVFGGEFDAMLAAQYAASCVGVVTFGSESKRVNLRWQMSCRQAQRILVCYDNDAAGDRGAEQWRAEMGNRVERVRVPVGKDLCEYVSLGGDVAEWLCAHKV